MIELYDYQVENNNRLRGLEEFGPSRAVGCLPTGGGKSICQGDMLLDDKPQLELTHRRFLLDQLSDELTRCGVRHGIIARGVKPDLSLPIQLGMIQTFYKRVYTRKELKLPEAARVHIDEVHTVAAMMAQRICGDYFNRGASIIGWTATPVELSHLFDHQVAVVNTPDLIARGRLVPPIMYGPDMIDPEKLDKAKRQANGEFMPSALNQLWGADDDSIFGRVLPHYHRLNPDQKPGMLFAQSVRKSLWFAQRFSACGVKAAHIDGDDIWVDGKFYESDTVARKEVFLRSRPDGDLKLLCNFFVLREGFNAPWMSHVILACMVGARHNFVQMCGRGLRTFEGKTHCVYQDHGGNWLRFPPIDSPEPWDMTTKASTLAKLRIASMRGMVVDGVRTPPREIEPINCYKCNAIRIAGDSCPVCGFQSTKRSRPVIQTNGRLRLVTGAAFKDRKIFTTPDDKKCWEQAYWACRDNHPSHTFEQVYCNAARNRDWRYLPRDLPLMPISELDWYKRVGDVPTCALIPKTVGEQMAYTQNRPQQSNGRPQNGGQRQQQAGGDNRPASDGQENLLKKYRWWKPGLTMQQASNRIDALRENNWKVPDGQGGAPAGRSAGNSRPAATRSTGRPDPVQDVPATDRQIAWLVRNGFEPPVGMTKAEASHAIDEIKAEQAAEAEQQAATGPDPDDQGDDLYGDDIPFGDDSDFG